MLFSLLLMAALAGTGSDQVPRRATFADAVQLANDGHEADALAAFQVLAATNPDDHQARLWIARLHERMHHPDRAEAVYRSVLLEDPSNIDARVGVAATLLARGEPDAAIDVLDAAERLAPQSDLVLATLGQAHRETGHPSIGIAYLERAVALAPTEQHRLRLEDARRAYLHRVETRGFTEQFNGPTPDSRSGDLIVDVRVGDEVRALARGQIQRKFGVREERGGGGLEWQAARSTKVRGHALIGPDARVMPEGDYLAEADYTYRNWGWTGTFRYFDFEGAWTAVVSPGATWLAADRLLVGLRYALTFTDANTFTARQTGHTVQLRGAYQWRPRLAVLASYASGVDDFDTFSIDRIGDFRADTASAGLRYELPTLTSVAGAYEHQWRERGIRMRRFTISLAQRF